MTDGIKLDNQPTTYAIPALFNAMYFAFATPSFLAAVAVPVFSFIGSGLLAPIVREWIKFYFDRKRHEQGIPLREDKD